MELQSFSYCQHEGKKAEWTIEDCSLNKINLIVGKNASGKSRTLNILDALAKQLSRKRILSFGNGKYNLKFNDDGTTVIYNISYENHSILEEKYFFGKKELMSRDKNGEGKIFSEEIGKNLKFKVPHNELAASAKRDSFQHPFLDKLYKWADRLILFRFGTLLGKDSFISYTKDSTKKSVTDIKNTDQTILKYKEGMKQNSKFVALIKKDMQAIGYNITKIDVGDPISIKIESTLTSQFHCLLVKEKDLKGYTDQNEMSQGMFRAFSLIIQINHASLVGDLKTVMIDDIGEGLDYGRSSSLVKLLLKKSIDCKFQLIMTTNDKFIMNAIPLEYWSIINRIGSNPIFLNYKNSKSIFDKFELTGLSNFDLFSSNYFLKK